MASTDRLPVQIQHRLEHPSPASASSSTLIVTPLPSKDDGIARPQPLKKSTKALRALSLSISFPPPASLPPPQRSGKGFVEPHRSHLPRRANTAKSKRSVKMETPRKSTLPPPEKDEDLIPSQARTQRHGTPSANTNNGHMPTHLLSLRLAGPSVRPITPPPTSLPHTPLPLSRTPQMSGTPSQSAKGHLEPQSSNLPRRHQRLMKGQERDGSPVSKVRHSPLGSGSGSGLTSATGKGEVSDDTEEESGSRGEGRQAWSGSRHYTGRVGSPLRADAEKARTMEDIPTHRVKKRSKTCLQEMGKGSGVFVGFLPCESDEKDIQEHMHVVVQSNADRLVLPLPRLPSPISLDCDTSSAATCVERRSYIDGMTALTDAQIQDGCAFIATARQTMQHDAESSLGVKILSPRSRPEDAMSLAIGYLAYSSPSSTSPPAHSPPSPPANVGGTSTTGAARLIPFGATPTVQRQTPRTRTPSFPGSRDDDEWVDIDVVNPPPNSDLAFNEPSCYTRAHALYMHLLDDVDLDSEHRSLWDGAPREGSVESKDRAGVFPLGVGTPLGCTTSGKKDDDDSHEDEGKMVIRSQASTVSVFGAQGGSASSGCLDREHGRDREREREREREQARGDEYRCVRAEWRGVLSYDGLTRLDGVWLGGSG